MNNEEIINQTISKFKDECSKLPAMDFVDKLHLHEELLIKTILEALLPS